MTTLHPAHTLCRSVASASEHVRRTHADSRLVSRTLGSPQARRLPYAMRLVPIIFDASELTCFALDASKATKLSGHIAPLSLRRTPAGRAWSCRSGPAEAQVERLEEETGAGKRSPRGAAGRVCNESPPRHGAWPDTSRALAPDTFEHANAPVRAKPKTNNA